MEGMSSACQAAKYLATVSSGPAGGVGSEVGSKVRVSGGFRVAPSGRPGRGDGEVTTAPGAVARPYTPKATIATAVAINARSHRLRIPFPPESPRVYITGGPERARPGSDPEDPGRIRARPSPRPNQTRAASSSEVVTRALSSADVNGSPPAASAPGL